MKHVLLAAALSSLPALAQAPSTMTPPPPPPAEAPPPAAAAAAPEAATTAPATTDTVPAAVVDAVGRLRWGGSSGAGWHLPQAAITLNAEGRAGYQVNDLFSVYGLLGGTVGFGFAVAAGIQGAQVQATLLAHWYTGAIAEVILGDLFWVGAGPVLASGALGGTTVGASSDGIAEVTVTGAVGWKPGIDLRLGFALGKTKTSLFKRSGFNIGLDVMVLFHPDAQFARVRADGPNGTAGAEVKTTGLAVTAVPLLMLGYDAR